MGRIGLIFISLLLCSCSASYHLKQMERQRALAIAKGAVIKTDTVYKEIEKKIYLPAESGNTNVDPVIDTTAVNEVMDKNDSLVIIIDQLHTQLKTGQAINKEKTMAALSSANAEIKALRSRIGHGFSKDSTYMYRPDSLTEISVTLKNGLVANIEYKRDSTTISWKEKLPIWINQKVSAGFTVLQLIGALLAGMVLMFVIMFMVRFLNKDK